MYVTSCLVGPVYLCFSERQQIYAGSLQTELFLFLTRKSLTWRSAELLRKNVPREELFQNWSVLLFFCGHLLIGSSRTENARMAGTFPHRRHLLITYLLSTSLPPPALFTHSISLPVLLKRDCKHQETLLLMRSSMTVAEYPCRNVCYTQESE